MHYCRWQRHGDPMIVAYIQGDNDARFRSYVHEVDSGCWHWTGYISPGGYGKFGKGGADGGPCLAHRWSYERWNGPIPKGWTVDHECHNADATCKGGPTCLHRRCVNPAHLGLQPTVAENLANSPNSNHRRTHCPQGHPYDEANTYVSKKGYRCCRKCHVVKQVALNRRKRAAKRALRQP